MQLVKSINKFMNAQFLISDKLRYNSIPIYPPLPPPAHPAKTTPYFAPSFHKILIIEMEENTTKPRNTLLSSNSQTMPSSEITNNFPSQHSRPTQVGDHQHITQPGCLNKFEVAQEIVRDLLAKVDCIIGVCSKAGELAIKQTLEILINDPNLGILDSKQYLPEHSLNIMCLDQEPKAKAIIFGHVKLQKFSKKQSSLLTPSSLTKLNQKHLKQSKKIISYSNSNKENNQVFNQKLAIQQVGARKTKHRYLPGCKNQKSVNEVSSAENSLVSLGKGEPQNNNHYINFLRHIKLGKNKGESIHPAAAQHKDEVTRRYFQNFEEKSQKRTNLASLNAGDRIKTLNSVFQKQGKSSSEEIKPLKLVPNKKTNVLNYESCVSVKQRQAQVNNYSFNISQLHQSKKYKNSEQRPKKPKPPHPMGGDANKIWDMKVPTLTLKRQCLPSLFSKAEKQTWKSETKQALQLSDKLSVWSKNRLALPLVKQTTGNQESRLPQMKLVPIEHRKRL